MKTEKITFPSLLSYLFDGEENPRIANAAHIKVGLCPNPAFAGEILFMGLDEERRIEAMFACAPESVLEPITVEFILD